MDIHRVYRALIGGFRRRRMARFARELKPTTATRVLDVGGTRFNWELIEARPRVTLLNLAAPDAAERADARFAHLVGSGTALPCADQSFDIAFSNSVIEHVGDADAQARFAAELRRVAGDLWLQTPARSFFFEPHLLTPFLHYLPRSWQRRLLRNFSVWGWLTRPDAAQVEAAVGGTRLLGHAELARWFPDCRIERERFLGFTKAYVVVRQLGARAASAGSGPSASDRESASADAPRGMTQVAP